MNIINRKKINNVVFEIVMFLLSAFVLIPLLMLIFGSLKSLLKQQNLIFYRQMVAV